MDRGGVGCWSGVVGVEITRDPEEEGRNEGC